MKWKIQRRASKADLIKQKRESVTLSTIHLKLSSHRRKKQNKLQSEECLWDLHDIIKAINICIMGVIEEEEGKEGGGGRGTRRRRRRERENRAESLFKK